MASIEGWDQFAPDSEQVSGAFQDLSLAYGYLACRGKDRRDIRDQVADFSALLTPKDRQLVARLLESRPETTDTRAISLVRRAAQILRERLHPVSDCDDLTLGQ